MGCTGPGVGQGVVVNVLFVCEGARAMGIDGHVCELQLVLRDCPFESVSRTCKEGRVEVRGRVRDSANGWGEVR